MAQDVALALSSGGPRGFAYIGAIEELQERGYHISSVSGTSIGSLVGGIFATGKLNEVKEWLFGLDAWKVFTLMDLSIGKNHLVKGDKVIGALKEIVPDINIEDLPTPFCAIATDLYTGEEVIFDKGPLFTAIRASISIPSLFRPVKYGDSTLIDGGIANCLPSNRVKRNGKDILVAFDVNDVDPERIRKDDRNDEVGDNYYSILSRTFSLMNHVNSRMSIERDRPDILASMPFDSFGVISDYAKAREISEMGRQLMRDALDRYENKSR